MADLEKTNIAWTDYSYNPWQGCTKVSPGCAHCYMYADKKRYGQNPEKVIRSKDPTFYKPLAKNRKKEFKIESGSKIFVCSWSDFFHPSADEWRPEVWEIIKKRDGVIFQIVTKRTHRIAECLPDDWGDGYPNVWLIVSVENTAMLPRVGKLLDIPAAVRGVSYEPALEAVDFGLSGPGQTYWCKCKCGYTGHSSEFYGHDGHDVYDIPCPKCEEVTGPDEHPNHIDWLICGGESGDNARPFQLDWARKTVKDCKDAGVACFVKQMGHQPMDGGEYVQLKHDKGEDIEEWEPALQVQEFPKGTIERKLL